MLKKPLLIATFFCCCLAVSAQPLEKAATNAFMITRMVAKFHVQPRTLDDAFSADLFATTITELDDSKIFFTQEDINKLSSYRYTLDEEITQRKTVFLKLLFNIYSTRLKQSDSLIDLVCRTPFNFSIKEKYTAEEDSTYPANTAAAKLKFYKIIKFAVLRGIIHRMENLHVAESRMKAFADSVEPVLRKKANRTVKRYLKKVLESPKGIDYIIGNVYCEALANCYDPHSDFLSKDQKDFWESEIGSKAVDFGFSVVEGDDGTPQIGKLKPGGAAFQSGQLNKGDRLTSIQWEGKDSIDVSDASAEEISALLLTNGAERITIGVRKPDGADRKVTLSKTIERYTDDDSKVKGYLLKGEKTIGFISLPAFYTDFETSAGIHGCANDVATEILKLRKQSLDGLVIDLRYNGGGSLEEAVELAGIFIDAGPILQYQSKESKPVTMKDPNRGTVYDGPMIVLVNGLSASASEMLAGALQDYHRAFIVGSRTYGKSTAQVILPLDTTISMESFQSSTRAEDFVKITISKIFRLDGSTAQKKSVIPDISLPEQSSESVEREEDDKHSLPSTTIAANKYYRPLAPLPVQQAQTIAQHIIDTSSYYRQVKSNNRLRNTRRVNKDETLLLSEAWTQFKQADAVHDSFEKNEETSSPSFQLKPSSQPTIAPAEDDKSIFNKTKYTLEHDPEVRIAYAILAGLAK